MNIFKKLNCLLVYPYTNRRSLDANTSLILSACIVIRISILLFGMNLLLTNSYAQDKTRKAPFAILEIPPYSKSRNAPQQIALAKQISETLCNSLKGKDLNVRSAPIQMESSNGDETKQLKQVADRSKVAWLLRARITKLKFEVRRELIVGFLVRCEITLDAEMIDASTGKTLKQYTSKGLRSIHLSLQKDQVFQGNEFSADDNSLTYAENAVQECINGDGKKKIGLSEAIASDFPDAPWSLSNNSKSEARLVATVNAESIEAASKVGSLEIFKKLIPRPTEGQSNQFQEKILPRASALVEVVQGKEKSSYSVSVAIDDLQSDRPNLVRELKQSGILLLPTLGVISDDPKLQSEIQGALTKAGFTVKDEQRLSALRNGDYVRIMLDGKADPVAIQRLKDASDGFDYIVFASVKEESKRSTGEGHSIQAFVRTTTLEPGTATIISASSSDESEEDSSPNVALERAISSAVESVKTKVITDLYAHLTAVTNLRTLAMVITGWSRYSDAEKFRLDLEKIPGVSSVIKVLYSGGVLTLKAILTEEARKNLALNIEANSPLKKYGLKIDLEDQGNIHANREPEQPIIEDREIEVKPKVKPTDKTVNKPAKKGN